MANPFGDDFEDEPDEAIKEGFLCPVCYENFATDNQLASHYLNSHADEGRVDSASSNLGSQIKGFIGKAKQKIKNFNDEDEELRPAGSSQPAPIPVASSSSRPSDYYSIWRENQQIGQTRDHFDQLKLIRDKRVERYVIETNKLLIRLDKLIRDAPTDIEKRKQHEKNVVMWANNADVPLCSSCAKSFNITRRRHHCRLCGGIMCHACSHFLEFSYAKKLISTTSLEEDSDGLSGSHQTPGILSRSSSRRGSNSSLMSIVNSATGEQHVRVCYDCKVLLDHRNKQIEDQRARPAVCHFYDRLRKSMDECEKLVPIYFKMCYSFSQGESTYSLGDASELRVKLMKLAELIDALSKKISTLGIGEHPQPAPIQLQLQAKMRLAATQFLKENMIGLPSLPSHEELEKAQEERRQSIQRKIQEEKEIALQEQRRRDLMAAQSAIRKPANGNMSIPRDESTSSFELVSPDTGWGPECEQRHKNPTTTTTDSDPMLLQINRVRSYIKQARADHRYDEVNMLEANLKELEIEYFIQKQDQEAVNQLLQS